MEVISIERSTYEGITGTVLLITFHTPSTTAGSMFSWWLNTFAYFQRGLTETGFGQYVNVVRFFVAHCLVSFGSF